MRTAVLALQVVFFVVAFGVRTAVQVVRTGDSGLRRPRGVTARTASGLMVAGGAGAGAATLVEPWATVPAGVVLVAGGAVLALAAQLAMGRSWRVGVDPSERTELVTHGPFRAVRNPIFTGMALTAVGTAVTLPSPLALAGAALMVAGIEVQVRLVEEPYLARTHGAAFAEYRRRTGRFLPGLGLR